MVPPQSARLHFHSQPHSKENTSEHQNCDQKSGYGIRAGFCDIGRGAELIRARFGEDGVGRDGRDALKREQAASPDAVKAVFDKAAEAEEDGGINLCGFYLGMGSDDARLLAGHYGLRDGQWSMATIGTVVYKLSFNLHSIRRITKGGNSFDELSQAVANRVGTMKPKRNSDYDLVGYGRVICGGSWYNYAYNCEAGYRSGRDTNSHDDHLGFRLAR